MQIITKMMNYVHSYLRTGLTSPSVEDESSSLFKVMVLSPGDVPSKNCMCVPSEDPIHPLNPADENTDSKIELSVVVAGIVTCL